MLGTSKAKVMPQIGRFSLFTRKKNGENASESHQHIFLTISGARIPIQPRELYQPLLLKKLMLSVKFCQRFGAKVWRVGIASRKVSDCFISSSPAVVIPIPDQVVL